MVTPRLLEGRVSHSRHVDASNAFTYRIVYLFFSLDHIHMLRRALLSVSRWNLFSVSPRDYGDGVRAPHQWIRDVLADWGLAASCNGRVMLLTLPRMLGYAFNPVSFWLCYDTQDRIRVVLSEVRNTFGEKHCYISFHDDTRPIMPDDIMTSRKVFHVSPYMRIEGEYHYQFAVAQDAIDIRINLVKDSVTQLRTQLRGTLKPLTNRRLLCNIVRCPFVTFKVTGLIYWQALKLAAKKVTYRRKPAPPATFITR